MRSSSLLFCLALAMLSSCQKETPEIEDTTQLAFEKISYYKYPVEATSQPYKYRVEYYFDNGKPHRWLELDSAGKMTTDYVYTYDDNWKHIGARYREDGTKEFSIEQVSFRNDSTMVTEWLDSLGNVYYTMIDNLNKMGKTYRAEFIGDKTHGFDSTFYTDEGFQKRIFFSSTNGMVYNDRSFVYDSVNANGDWVTRKKIMGDTLQELQKRETYYNNLFTSANNRFYEGIISSGEWSENVISFTEDESKIFLTRTLDWEHQIAYMAEKNNGIYPEMTVFRDLDTIYNGAISPSGDKFIYSVRDGETTTIHLLSKDNSQWTKPINLSAASGLEGGYFYWMSETEICFQTKINNGDLVFAELKDNVLSVTDSLSGVNTKKGTEFSPYVAENKAFIIYTRYIDGHTNNQGFVISYSSGTAEEPAWNKPFKLDMLPYGWSANIINNNQQFIYTDGDDIYTVPLETLNLKTP